MIFVLGFLEHDAAVLPVIDMLGNDYMRNVRRMFSENL